MKKFTSLLLAGVLLLQSCASIMSKSYYPIIINSYPPEAKIIVRNKKGIEVYTGNTPAVLKLKASSGFFSKAHYQVKFIKEGYYTRIVPIDSFRIDNSFYVNFLAIIVFAPFVLLGAQGAENFANAIIAAGLIIDGATGSMYTLDKESLDVILIKSTSNVQKEELKD